MHVSAKRLTSKTCKKSRLLSTEDQYPDPIWVRGSELRLVEMKAGLLFATQQIHPEDIVLS